MLKLAKGIAAAGTALALTVFVAPVSQARPVWDTSPVRVERTPQPLPKVVDLRVGAHRNFDRVVIDLRGRFPGYDVRYVKRLVMEGSGDPVDLRGRRFISIAVDPSRAHDRSGDSVYDGPLLQQYNLDTLRGVALTGDFEGVVGFGLSLRHKADFRVTVLHAPNRIVIDLRH